MPLDNAKLKESFPNILRVSVNVGAGKEILFNTNRALRCSVEV